MRSLAINVGANTNEPGFRGPIRPDGSFTYVPIPESAATTEAVPTYGDLAPHLDADVPASVRDRPVHLDPEFATYPCCEAYTYGDNHGIKAGPISELTAGDYLFFYATLSTVDPTASPDWIAPEWGAYLVGHFRLADAPVTADALDDLSPAQRTRFANNAHCKRDPFDARVLVAGDPDDSLLYDRAVPLSGREAGATANRLVTDCSDDSGAGPWWRRPLGFDADATEALLTIHRTRAVDRCFE